MVDIDINAGPSDSRPEHEQEAKQRQRIDYLADELTHLRADIVDDDLREAVSSWLVAVDDIPGGNVEDYVSEELADIRARFPMYRTRKIDDPTEAFPDRCEGCPHYGVACPVLTDNTEISRRKRIFDGSESPSELRRRLREYAIDNECKVLQQAVSAISDQHQPLLKQGQLLLMHVEDRVLYGDESEVVKRALAGLQTAKDFDGAEMDLFADDELADLLDADDLPADTVVDETDESVEVSIDG